MEVIKLGEEIYGVTQRLHKGVDTLGTLAANYCEAEREYRKALGIEKLKLRDQKVPVSLINDVARGNIADLKFNRDLAEQKHKTGRDMMNALEAELSGLQTIFKKFENI